VLNLRSAMASDGRRRREHQLLLPNSDDFRASFFQEGMMRMLLPIGVILVVLGAGGYAASCYSTSLFDGPENDTAAAQLQGQTDAPATELRDSGARVILAPLSGIIVAIGLICLAIGMGKWRRPVPSDVRPANPWSDQPREHGEPPRGLV
jgi:hypothetical protein